MNIYNDITLIAICLFAVIYYFAIKARLKDIREHFNTRYDETSYFLREFIRATNSDLTKVKGFADEARIKARISEKFAERAFNLASSANLACVALSKTLAVRQTSIKKPIELAANEKAKEEIKEIFTPRKDPTEEMDDSGFEWLYPILSDEERDVLDKAREHTSKYRDKAQ